MDGAAGGRRAMDEAHALVVGIAAYRHVPPLPPTVLSDARDVHDLLVDPQLGGYPPGQVQLLLDDQATLAALRDALARLAASGDGASVVLLYLSGHGGRIAGGDLAGEYLLPVDADATSEASLAATALSGQALTEALRAIPARKLLVVFDCCHAGGIGQPKAVSPPGLPPILVPGLSEGYYAALQAGRGRVILASSRSTEFSYVLPGATNSLFTQHLLAGLRGGAAGEDGLVRVFDLFEYLQPRVTAEAPEQHPLFKGELEENFPVALSLAGRGAGSPGPRGPAGEDYRYDAYISYVDREPDASWVWQTLVPRLEGAGLRLAVSGDSEDPGVARVVGVERGIRQAKRTVVVLSEAYLADGMAEFENVLAQTLGIQESSYRLLPVKIDPLDAAQLPVRLSMLAMLDLGHPSRAERNFARLVRALQDPLPRR